MNPFHFRSIAVALCLVACATGPHANAFPAPEGDWRADWIGVIGGSKPNTWLCFRKDVRLDSAPQAAVARIACDSKYWLWINGEPVVFEGQLKRGPTPTDTYFDRVDLTAHLRAGANTIAVLVQHFGRHGFSHNNSGKAALLLDADVDGQPLLSDSTWRAKVHPAFGTTDPPLDNVRPPEANVRFDARHDIGDWRGPEYDDSDWGPPTLFGKPPTAPWNELYERPIPQWADSGLRDYEAAPATPLQATGEEIVCRLPYNAQVTPYLEVDAPAGKVIGIHTDVLHRYGTFRQIETHRHEYVTRDGVQQWELPSWINGHEVHYDVPAGVRVLRLAYRETGYDTRVVGRFRCDDSRLNQLWDEAARTLYVTMRDTYMDCPDRERAQWWGDAVNELGEAFYVFEPQRAPQLTRKAIYELCRWQRPDDTLYSPVPSGVRRDGILYPLDGSWEQELPRQMLASVGWYGFWTYYWYTGDRQTVVDAYPAVRRYMSLWRLGDDGLVEHRAGGWDWTDWGEHRDVPVIENAWVYLALKAACEMAELAGEEEDIAEYQRLMASIRDNFRPAFWRNGEYRSAGHQGPTDDRAAAMAVVAGLAEPADHAGVAETLRTQRHASPYMEKYVLEALLQIGRPDDAFDRMVERYDYMLGDGLSTLWEFFDPFELEGFGDMGRGTYNHAWSGGPLTILSQYVAGVAPTAPAFARFEVRPQLGRLRTVQSTTPTPRGPIELSIERMDDGALRVSIESPAEYDGVLVVPAPAAHGRVTRDGETVWQVGEQAANNGPAAPRVDGENLRLPIPPGGSIWTVHPR
ncbi:alpha-L-rhamnosidase C-terminal domain-containing protein [Botrimarina sp.]|uniref:alpha-L-rhamnosidase-related protein n=1 Tax=Botrimarina sp. TaxID=2795802 RepID=UPI0032EC6F14